MKCEKTVNKTVIECWIRSESTKDIENKLKKKKKME